MPRVLTGITPSGTLHIGNYFGAMRPAIELQAGGDAYYFIADYHSMTALTDARERRAYTQGIALDWLACGLDPAKAVFWRQSDIPEVCELTWLIGSLTPMGLLERAHSYKDKTAKGIDANFGLFAYPVLMAADIILFDTNIVPVGKDQKQHLEMTRDIAIKFNLTYGDTFIVPEERISETLAVIPGLDGQKMSKSYGNTIEIFGDEKALRKKNHGHRHGLPHARRAQARRRQEPRHPAPEALRAAGHRGRLRAAAPRRRPRLRRPQEGAVRTLLEFLRALPHEACRTRR
jgi:tryptophanyl-tRNA synthetase